MGNNHQPKISFFGAKMSPPDERFCDKQLFEEAVITSRIISGKEAEKFFLGFVHIEIHSYKIEFEYKFKIFLCMQNSDKHWF